MPEKKMKNANGDKELVAKLLSEISLTDVYLDFEKAHPGKLKESAFRALRPPELRRMSRRHLDMCGCRWCSNSRRAQHHDVRGSLQPRRQDFVDVSCGLHSTCGTWYGLRKPRESSIGQTELNFLRRQVAGQKYRKTCPQAFLTRRRSVELARAVLTRPGWSRGSKGERQEGRRTVIRWTGARDENPRRGKRVNCAQASF